MGEGRKLTRRQFLAIIGGAVLSAALAKLATAESRLVAITGSGRGSGYGQSVYGGD